MTERIDAIHHWLATLFPDAAFELVLASSDASFRRYFRVQWADRSLIVMDAPPAQEDCRPFVEIAQLFSVVHVPQVLAQDLEQGFLLLSDLGSTPYLAGLSNDNAQALMVDAIDTLVTLQQASVPGVLPEYDAALLRREMELFPEWFAARHLGRPFTAAQQIVWQDATQRLVDAALKQAQVFVHRDYIVRNLMVCEPGRPGVLDFQDAVYGPISYDIMTLLRDAYLTWDDEFVLDMAVRYWERARKVGLPVPSKVDDFYRDFEWMGVQRHLKVAGIFARLNYRDGKANYLPEIPRFLNFLKHTCNRYEELRPLGELVRDLSGESAQVGYTF